MGGNRSDQLRIIRDSRVETLVEEVLQKEDPESSRDEGPMQGPLDTNCGRIGGDTCWRLYVPTLGHLTSSESKL